MPSFTQVQSHEYPAGDAPFNVAGVGGAQPYFHDDLDRRRAMWRQTPEAQFPDGYLGNVNSRRGDRLMNGLKQRTTAKPYTRGVHKGERRDPSDYIWPDEFNPMSGLAAQSVGEKFTSPGFSMDMDGSLLVNDGKPSAHTVRGVPVSNGAAQYSPDRQSQLKRLAPPWSGRGPGMVVSPMNVGRG